jgi:hypothetical protein
MQFLDDTFTRLAYPVQTPALLALGENPEERRQILALLTLTGPVSVDADAYVRRPFEFPTISRFSDGNYGVLYAANSLITAVRESAYHLGRFFADGSAPETQTRRMRLEMHVRSKVTDIRRSVRPRVNAAIYDPDDYRVAQDYGRKVRARTHALHYDSVRNRHGGHCVGAFVPEVVARAAVVGEVGLVWNGQRFVEAHEIVPL